MYLRNPVTQTERGKLNHEPDDYTLKWHLMKSNVERLAPAHQSFTDDSGRFLEYLTRLLDTA